MTLPTTFSWFVRGQRLCVPYEAPYEAPQGRRVNGIGALFTHGPLAGRFEWHTLASLPKNRAKKPRQNLFQIASRHRLEPQAVGVVDGACLVEFLWRLVGRPPEAANWKRERPLVIVLDNYSVHKGQAVQQARPALAQAGVFLFYLPTYCPELSRIEPVWNDLKQHHLPQRSFEHLGDLKRAVDHALAQKAKQLRHAYAKTTDFQHPST